MLNRMLNRNLYLLISLLFLGVISIASCRKVVPEDSPNEGYQPWITIHEPEDYDVVPADEPLDFKIAVENNDKIRNVEITLLNETTGDTLYYSSSNAKCYYYYSIDHEVSLNADPADYILQVSTWDRNHASEKTTEEVRFRAE